MTPSAASPRKERVIVWFRRDLRVADNPALAAALQMAKEVIPVFIWAPEEEGQFQPGRCLRWWLHSSLRAFEEDLAALGSRMVYAKAAESRFALAELVRELGAQAVLFNHLYDPISMVRDNEVKATLAAAGVFCQSFNADILREPWEVLDGSGQPFTCFEDFWNAHCSLPYPPPPPLPVAARLPPVAKDVGALSLGELGMMLPEEEMSNVQLEYHWTPGGAGAHEILAGFLSKRLQLFDRDRAKTDRASTSRLSPHIHCGEISVRYIYYVAKQKEAEWASRGEGGSSVADFLRQVGYREYSRYLSFHFPFTHERSLLEHLRAVPWKFDQRLFKAWRQGRTGYPLVDAGMRELWSTGWIHNRIRVVCASFMVKNLLLPWQWGLKHYWDAQLDADLESDALGWQYCAGCMADAHDFSYMIDLGTESKRFDPDGNYVRRWLPVLARLPAKYIHTPWEAPMQILDDAGVELGVNYPLPVISEQQAAEDLAKAHAIVLQCQRGEEGCGEVGGSADYAAGVAAGAADISWPRGPFRPPTEPPPLGLGERLWGDRDDYGAGGVVSMFEGPGHGGAVAGGMSAAVFGASGRRRRSLEAADSAQASEDVQSNVVVCDDMSEVRAPPLRPQQATASIAPLAGPVAVGRRLPRPGNRGSPPRAAAAAATGLLAAEPWPSPVARAGTGGTSGGDGNRATATDYRVPSLSAGPSGARVPDSTAGAMPQSSTEAAQQAYSARGQGATSPWNGGVGTTGVPLSSGHTVVLRHSAGQSSWGEAGSALPPAAKRDVAAPSQEGSPGVSRPHSKRQRSVDYAGLKVMAATAAVDAGDGTGGCNSTADRGRDR